MVGHHFKKITPHLYNYARSINFNFGTILTQKCKNPYGVDCSLHEEVFLLLGVKMAGYPRVPYSAIFITPCC